MKFRHIWTIIPVAIASLAVATGAKADTLNITETSANPVVVESSVSATQSSPCGNIAIAPSHVVTLADDFDNLRFTVAGEGQPTLMIQEAGGRTTCVQADGFSGGVVEVPGFWAKGSYTLFIGNRSPGQYSYTLSISHL